MDILAFLAIFGAFLFVILLAALVLYILMSVGLYKMAKNRGLEYDWLSFIPIAQLYIMGKLIQSLKIFNYEIPSIEVVLPVGAVITAILGSIPVLGFIIWLAMGVLFYSSLFKLFCLYRPKEQAQTMLVVSLVSLMLGGFMAPVYVFLLAKQR